MELYLIHPAILSQVTRIPFHGGTLDLAFRKTYEASLLVGNQLAARGSKDTLRAETSRVTLRGAEVTHTSAQGNQLYRFSVNGTGFVDVSVCAPGASPWSYERIDWQHRAQRPGLIASNWLGTDRLGRDLLVRTLQGVRG